MSKPAPSLPLTLLLALGAPLACSDDGGSSDATSDTDGGDGDPGDGDPGDGDLGDGDPGDGDPGDGDPGDGDPGDGDPGDGDPGDGDGDPSPMLPEDFPDSLTEITGCGDVSIYAIDPMGTAALYFSGAELVAMAHEMNMPLDRVSELPSPDVSLRVVLGSDLGEVCTDTGPGPTITQEWTAVSGTVSLGVVPFGMAEPWEAPADATLELTDVTFEGGGARTRW